MNFTADQKKAIEISDKNLLVSASAGTGKTTVMIERIIRLISTGKASVDEIMVVTFTTAAANQMKEKLRKSLNEKANDPYFFAQLEKLDTCGISTLHSFCSDILREYFYVADVDPSFSILEPAAADALRQKTLDSVFSDYYAANDETFGSLTRIFHAKRSDVSLKEIVSELYDFSRCVLDFYGWYDGVRRDYLAFGRDNPFEKTLNEEIVSRGNLYSEYFEGKSVWAKKIGANEFAEYLSAYAAYFRFSDKNSLENNLDKFTDKFDLRRNGKMSDASRYKVQPEEFELITNEISAIKKKATDWRKKYEALAEIGYGELVENTKKTLPLLDKLVELTKNFENIYAAEKKEKSALDFSDLERLALEVLKDEKARAELKEKYKYVFVDEYQDINSVQEAIISRICGERNLFLVGDVKQSIYGFRETNPDIFVDKITEYVDKNDSLVINLNNNFRSDKRILDYVNSVFSEIMTKKFGKVDYAETALLAGENNCETAMPTVCLEFVQVKESETVTLEKYDIETAPTVGEMKAETTAQALADKITGLVGTEITENGVKRTVGYGDIAVLVRDMKDGSKAIYNKLKSLDIPVSAVFGDNLLSKECLDVINFLRAIDNPLNDIYLCGAALSPFGGLTEQELAEVKIYSKQKVFIDNLTKYVAENRNTLSAKIKAFLNFLEKYRKYSYSLTADELMQRLVTDHGICGGGNYLLYVKGLSNGQMRYEKLTETVSSVKGKQFASSVDKYLAFLDENKTFSVSAPDFSDAVTLTTIHKSKGLEYPIVIAANLEKRFNHRPKDVLTDRNLGLAMRYYDFSDKTVNPALSYVAVDLSRRRREKEEEMRLLYVLLTRAKSSLILLANGNGGKPAAPELADSFLDWLCCAKQNVIGATPQKTPTGETAVLKTRQSGDIGFVKKSFEYRYPYKMQITPLKISASRIRANTEEEESNLEPPVFSLAEKGEDVAAVGTAYHRIFEKLGFGETVDEIADLIEKAVQKNEFTKTAAEKIKPELIYNAINNPDLKKLLTDREIHREIPFMLKVPYNTIFPESESADKTVLQGVIDMLAVGEKSAAVIDFKYTSHPEYIKRNYAPQLKAYALAVEKILGLKTEAFALSVVDNNLIKII